MPGIMTGGLVGPLTGRLEVAWQALPVYIDLEPRPRTLTLNLDLEPSPRTPLKSGQLRDHSPHFGYLRFSTQVGNAGARAFGWAARTA